MPLESATCVAHSQRDATCSKADLLEYIGDLVSRVGPKVAALDLASPDSGFAWYKIPKLDHQILNVRHLGTRVGKLQELPYAEGAELDWVSRR